MLLDEKPRIPIKSILLIGTLPSFLKKIIYRLKGYKLGKGVKIGFGSVIKARKVNIGNHTSIGFGTIIQGDEIIIGNHVSIGSTTIIDTPRFEIGDDSKINEMVFVGGPKLPESSLKIGANTIIMQMSFINPTKPIEIGDDSGIGGHCLLFSHGSWLNIFEGYPVTFAPIKLGKSVWLPWRVFIMPGTEIGDGSVIGANSLVSGTIPPYSLAAGSPAKVIRSAPDFPKKLSDSKKDEVLGSILIEFESFVENAGIVVSDGDGCRLFTKKTRGLLPRKKSYGLYVGNMSDPHLKSDIQAPAVFLSLPSIEPERREQLNRSRIMWIDVEAKERGGPSNDLGEELALFLTRYGLRLTRTQKE